MAPVAEPREAGLLQLPNPIFAEPTTVILDALIVHPNAQTVKSPLVGCHPPVAIFSMKRYKVGQPFGPHGIVFTLALSGGIPDKTDLVEPAHLFGAQKALPLQQTRFHNPVAQIGILRPFSRYVTVTEAPMKLLQPKITPFPARPNGIGEHLASWRSALPQSYLKGNDLD